LNCTVSNKLTFGTISFHGSKQLFFKLDSFVRKEYKVNTFIRTWGTSTILIKYFGKKKLYKLSNQLENNKVLKLNYV